MGNKRVIAIGNGWIANRLKDVWPDMKIVDSVRKLEEEIRNYDIVINCAAKTNIDWCEQHKPLCFESNVLLAIDVADLCYQLNKKHVFISSACIFESANNQDIKQEDSQPNPACFYALTKWMAEEMIGQVCPTSLIVRIRLPLSEQPDKRNTINKILTYPYLNNAQETVTVIEDFLPAFRGLVEIGAEGVYHLVNAGTISPSEIGTAFGHKHVVQTKEEQDIRMKWEGKAKRVHTVATSTKIPLLPDIHERMDSLVRNYKHTMQFM